MNANSKLMSTFRTVYLKRIQFYYTVFYAVGIVGLMLPTTFPFFLKLFPFVLLVSFSIALFYHEHKLTAKTLFVFFLIFATSFGIEAIGVNTGIVFGNYYYGQSLGIKLFSTPLIIGLNWLLLIYLSAALFEHIGLHPYLKVLIASLVMVIYDLVLEQVASKLDMWYWTTGKIPFRNYVAWFLIALFLHSFFRLSGMKANNKLAKAILFVQFGFFMILLICFKTTGI